MERWSLVDNSQSLATVTVEDPDTYYQPLDRASALSARPAGIYRAHLRGKQPATGRLAYPGRQHAGFLIARRRRNGHKGRPRRHRAPQSTHANAHLRTLTCERTAAALAAETTSVPRS